MDGGEIEDDEDIKGIRLSKESEDNTKPEMKSNCITIISPKLYPYIKLVEIFLLFLTVFDTYLKV